MTSTMIHNTKKIITKIDKSEDYDVVKITVISHDGSIHDITIFGDDNKPVKITKLKTLKE